MPQQNRYNPRENITLTQSGLEKLLDYLPHPALLLDDELWVLGVNQQALQFSGYTQSGKLVNKPIALLFPSLGKARNAPRALHDLPKKAIYTILLTQDHKRVPVVLQHFPLGDQQSCCLVTFESASKEAKQQGRHNYHANMMRYLERLFTIPEESDPLEQISAACGEWLGSDCVAIYLCETASPIFRKAAVWGDASIFPKEIPPVDLQHFLEPSIWMTTQPSSVTILQQAARVAGHGYLASAPIGETGAWNGILVAAGSTVLDEETTLPILQMLSAAAALHLRQRIRHTNLETQLNQATRRLAVAEAMSDALAEGVILVSPQNKIQETNAAAEYILGYAGHEIYEQPIENVLIGTDRLAPAIKLALQGVPTPNLGKVRLHRRDGSSFAARVQTAPAQKDGESLGVLVIFQDISEHEQAKIRTQQLEQRALLGEVTAVFAHEVRNPINNISTGLQLMAINTPDEDTETQALIGRLLGDCTRLTDLMESILAFSRTGNYKFTPLNLENLLERLLTRWRPRLERLNIKYHVQVAPDTLPIRGDRRSLEQVFTNLISNAVRAMGESGGTLAVKIGPYYSPGGKAFTQVDLSDTGPGIPEEIRTRIFDPFFTTDPNGTGLGLSITKQIITAHRGSIYPTSFPGGTVFHVQIPALGATEELTL